MAKLYNSRKIPPVFMQEELVCESLRSGGAGEDLLADGGVEGPEVAEF